MQVISVNNNYASGLRRLVAFIIDCSVISVTISVLSGFGFGHRWEWSYDWQFDNWPMHMHLFNSALQNMIFLIYYSFMESSKYQGTLGKIALGMKVVDKDGQRLELPKAILRNLSKIISGLLFGIGFIMIIFDERKQGLHDKIADTFVVKT